MKAQSLTRIAIGLTTAALSIANSQAANAANLVQNGGFVPNVSTTGSLWVGGTGANAVDIPGWTVNPTTDTSGAVSKGFVFLIPDGNRVHTNLASSNPTVTPFGGGFGAAGLYGNQAVNSVDRSGWYFGSDGDQFLRGSIDQQLNNLSVGQQYTVQFSQAAGQQNGYTGSTTERWNVSFGGTSQLSSLITINGTATQVTDWQPQTMTFTANASSQVLSFLAVGTPTGLPPFSLLSGVSVTVPEPFTIIGTLIGGTAALRLRKRLKFTNKL